MNAEKEWRRPHQPELTPARPIKDYPLAVRKRARQLTKARWDRQSKPKQPGR
jgi:hypothetical protein